MKALREKFSWSQEDVAARSGGGLDRNYVSKIEIGHNKASSYGVRESLAVAFGVSLQTMTDFVLGRIEVDAVYEEARRRGHKAASDLQTLSRDLYEARLAYQNAASDARSQARVKLESVSRAWLNEALADLDRRSSASDFADASRVIESVGGVWRTEAGRDAAVLALAMKLREERCHDRAREYAALRQAAET